MQCKHITGINCVHNILQVRANHDKLFYHFYHSYYYECIEMNRVRIDGGLGV